MRTLVTFQSSAFNTSEPKPYFINPGCFGDDLCRWLIARLNVASIQTDAEPGQEDFGWYFRFTVAEERHCFVVGYRPDEAEAAAWVGWIERDRGFAGSLLGARNRGIATSAAAAVHQALSDPAHVRNIKWHHRADFDRGDEHLGAETPMGMP